MRRIVSRTSMSASLVFALLTASALFAQDPEQPSDPPQMMQRMRQMMEGRRQQMMEQRESILDQLRASNQRLDELVAIMNSSGDQAKGDAIAAVVSELVAGRKALLDLVEAQPAMMQQMQMMEMMQQMMERMPMGGDAQSPGGQP